MATVRSGRFTHEQECFGNPGPIPIRAKKMFLIGPCWQVGQWGFDKREVDIDEHYAAMMVEGNSIVRATRESAELKIEWFSGRAESDELRACAELHDITARAKTIFFC